MLQDPPRLSARSANSSQVSRRRDGRAVVTLRVTHDRHHRQTQFRRVFAHKAPSVHPNRPTRSPRRRVGHSPMRRSVGSRRLTPRGTVPCVCVLNGGDLGTSARAAGGRDPRAGQHREASILLSRLARESRRSRDSTRDCNAARRRPLLTGAVCSRRSRVPALGAPSRRCGRARPSERHHHQNDIICVNLTMRPRPAGVSTSVNRCSL